MQVEFIDRVCVPLYTILSESFPWIKPLLDGALSNRSRWSDLEEKVKMGLTWIDHDIIEVPVEEVEVSHPKNQYFSYLQGSPFCVNSLEPAFGLGSSLTLIIRGINSFRNVLVLILFLKLTQWGTLTIRVNISRGFINQQRD